MLHAELFFLENNAQDTSSNESVYQRILNGTKNQFMRVKNIFSSNATQGASWHILSEIEEAQVPPYPGVYELKLRSAKRSGFLGSCLNLQFQIRQLKRQQSSGNILLEQMFSNSTAQIEMCYETCNSIAEAVLEEKTRLQAFFDFHKKYPVYQQF